MTKANCDHGTVLRPWAYQWINFTKVPQGHSQAIWKYPDPSVDWDAFSSQLWTKTLGEHYKTWRNNEKQCTPFPEHSKSTFALHLGPCLPKTFLLRRSRKSFQQWLTFAWQTWPPKQIIARRCMFLHFKKTCQSPASFPTSKLLLQSLSESIPFLTQITEPSHVCPWGDNPMVLATGMICPPKHPKLPRTLTGILDSHQNLELRAHACTGTSFPPMPATMKWRLHGMLRAQGIFTSHSDTRTTWFYRLLGGMIPFFGTLHHLAILGYTQFWTSHDTSAYAIRWAVSPKILWNGWFQPFPLSKIHRKLLNPIDFLSNPIETVFLLRKIPRTYHDTSIPP